jgi:outer membrane lipoprotein-sorting protein
VLDSGNVKLTWQTPYEINAAYFVVERSLDMRNFSPIDTLAAKGSTTTTTSYLTFDTRPWLGLNFYRLKTVAKDGTVTYSETERVVLTLRDLLKKLLWCLFGHQLQVWVDMGKYGPAQLQLIDLQGHIRYQTQMILNKGKNLKTVDVSKLPTGIYFLRIQSLEGSQVSKILIN